MAVWSCDWLGLFCMEVSPGLLNRKQVQCKYDTDVITDRNKVNNACDESQKVVTKVTDFYLHFELDFLYLYFSQLEIKKLKCF